MQDFNLLKLIGSVDIIVALHKLRRINKNDAIIYPKNPLINPALVIFSVNKR